jgi:hypothetical protein
MIGLVKLIAGHSAMNFCTSALSITLLLASSTRLYAPLYRCITRWTDGPVRALTFLRLHHGLCSECWGFNYLSPVCEVFVAIVESCISCHLAHVASS